MPQQLDLLDRVPLFGAPPAAPTPRELGADAADACADKAEPGLKRKARQIRRGRA